MSGQVSQQAADGAARFAAAHRALLADRGVQFDLRESDPPPQPPAWLKAFSHWLGEVLRPVGRLLRWIGQRLPDAPYARILLWSVLALLAAALAALVYQRVRHGEWRLPRLARRRAEQVDVEEEWTPAAAPVRAWLEEADALAGDGRYAEAVHHLLIRSVEDIGRRRPRLLRPALTSRDIAADDAIPLAPRRLFAGLAAMVERSLFGGRGIDAEGWSRARATYADFAQARAWSTR